MLGRIFLFDCHHDKDGMPGGQGAVFPAAQHEMPGYTAALMMFRLFLPCCLCGLGSAQAAELVLHDLRFDLEWLPTEFDYDLDTGLIQTSGSDSFDQALGVNVGGIYGFTDTGQSTGLFLGGELTYGQYTFASDGLYEAMGLRLLLGYGWQLSDDWVFLGEVYGGYGLASMEFPETVALSAFDVEGATIDYGGRLGFGYHLSESCLLSLSVGYGMSQIDMDDDDIAVDIEQQGVSFLFGVTYRFAPLPSPFE